jgi:hypothetical protein
MRTIGCVRLVLLAGVVLAGGCATTVGESDLRRVAESTKCDTIGRVYYLGREGGYDYFTVGWNAGERTYRIAVPNGVVRAPMDYGSGPVLVGPFEKDRWLP